MKDKRKWHDFDYIIGMKKSVNTKKSAEKNTK